LFDNDTISAKRVTFNEEAIFQDQKSKFYLALGLKQILFSNTENYSEIFDIMVIDEKYPKSTTRQNTMELTDRSTSNSRVFKFLKESKAQLLKKHLIEFQKPNIHPNLELNPFKTISYPFGYEDEIQRALEELKDYASKMASVLNGNEPEDEDQDEYESN